MPIVVGNDIGPMAGVAAYGGSQAAEREKWKKKYLEMLMAQGKSAGDMIPKKKPIGGWTNVFGKDLGSLIGTPSIVNPQAGPTDRQWAEQNARALGLDQVTAKQMTDDQLLKYNIEKRAEYDKYKTEHEFKGMEIRDRALAERGTQAERFRLEKEAADAKAKAEAEAAAGKIATQKDIIDYKYTAKDKARKAQLEEARNKLESNQSMSEEQKKKAREQIDNELLGIKPIPTEPIDPEKEGMKRIWELKDSTGKGTGTWLSIDDKGNVSPVHTVKPEKVESPKKKDMLPYYKEARESLIKYDENGKTVLPEWEDVKKRAQEMAGMDGMEEGTGQPPPPPPPPAGPPISDPEVKKLYDRKKAGGILTEAEEQKMLEYIQKIESEMGINKYAKRHR